MCAKQKFLKLLEKDGRLPARHRYYKNGSTAGGRHSKFHKCEACIITFGLGVIVCLLRSMCMAHGLPAEAQICFTTDVRSVPKLNAICASLWCMLCRLILVTVGPSGNTRDAPGQAMIVLIVSIVFGLFLDCF